MAKQDWTLERWDHIVHRVEFFIDLDGNRHMQSPSMAGRAQLLCGRRAKLGFNASNKVTTKPATCLQCVAENSSAL